MADLLEVSISGTGALGEITGASISGSSITNHSPADSSPTIATVSLTGKSTDSSQFLSNNNIHIEEMNGLGQIDGIVDTVSVSNATTNISGPSALSRFLTGNINIPAITSGTPASAMDLAMQLTGEQRASNTYSGGTSDNMVVYTMLGHGAGFGPNGTLMAFPDTTNWVLFTRAGQDFRYPQSVSYFPPAFSVGFESALTGKIYANNTASELIMKMPILDTSKRGILNFIFPKDAPNATEFGLPTGRATLGYQEADSVAAYLGFDYESTNNRFKLFYESVANPGETTSTYISTAGLAGNEWLVSMSFRLNSSNNLNIQMHISDTDGTNLTSGTIAATAVPDVAVLLWANLPAMRMVRTDLLPSAWTGWNTPYEIATEADIAVSNFLSDNAISGMNGTVWDYLNQVCSAGNVEVAMVDNIVTLRERGLVELSADSFTQAPVISPVSNKAEKVSLEWSEASVTTIGIYDVPGIYSVSVGDVQEVLLDTPNYYSGLLQPEPKDVTDMLPPSTSSGYAISGSDNLPIDSLEWLNYGGSLKVETTDIYGQIKMTLTAPTEEIPGVSGPYSFAASDGSTSYPLIRIPYIGTEFSDTIITVSPTGAEPSSNTQVEPVSFTNVCATSWEKAWDIIASGAKNFAGPRTTVTFTIPSRDALGFGLAEGSLFRIKNSTYRVMSVTFNIGTTSITALPYNTFDSFEDAWTGKTYTDFATLWGSDEYTYEDFSIAPLTTTW